MNLGEQRCAQEMSTFELRSSFSQNSRSVFSDLVVCVLATSHRLDDRTTPRTVRPAGALPILLPLEKSSELVSPVWVQAGRSAQAARSHPALGRLSCVCVVCVWGPLLSLSGGARSPVDSRDRTHGR